MRCTALTKKGHRCPNQTEIFFERLALCHLHHPKSLYRLQVAAERAERREERATFRMKSQERYEDMLARIRADQGLSQPVRRA